MCIRDRRSARTPEGRRDHRRPGRRRTGGPLMSLQPVTERPRELAATRRRAVRARRVQTAEPVPKGRTRISLWLPLTPLFWLLAPFAMLLAPLILLAPPLWRASP